MYSPSYLKKKLLGASKKRERNYYAANVVGVVAFLGIALFLAPLIHDLSHVLTLKLFNCPYNFYFGGSWHEEFHAEIETFCELSDGKAIIMLGAGIFGTFSLSLLLFFLSFILGRKGKLPLSNFFLYPALGFLIDPLFYFFAEKGDIFSILKILNKIYLFQRVYLIGIALISIVIVYIYFHMKSIWKDYEEIKKNIAEVENFLSESKKKSKD